ncbi:helix-turn-helix domain-containing protein [Aquimarina sp. AU474]|uniref:helix-turn-helix domain-containing protein n=1 Tax=Aquimarina sp. AU474 TaxID=2108529 RepID=UPI000D68E6F2|nr:helix-turn-helix domain-containing protein [Aquimarina sp. AU474]
MKINPYNIILLLGCLGIAVFAVFNLLCNKKKKKTFKYFYYFLITASLVILQILLIDFGITKLYSWILILYTPFEFLSPVLFTAFTCYYLEKEEVYQKYRHYLLIPFVVFFIIYTVIKVNIFIDYSVFSRSSVSFLLNEIDENFAVIFCFLLSVWNYRIIQEYENSLGRLSFVYVRKKTKWIKSVFITLVLLSIFWMLTIILFFIKEEVTGHSAYYPIWILYMIFCYVFIFLGRKHLNKVSGRVNNLEDPIQEKITKFQLSGLEHVFSEKELQLIHSNPISITGILSYFATSLFDKNKSNDVLLDIVENCISQLQIQQCSIYMVCNENKVLIPKATYNNKTNCEIIKKEKRISIPIEGILGKVVMTGKYQYIEDLGVVEDNNNNVGKSKLSIPLFIKEKVIGVLDVEHDEKSYFEPYDITLFLLIAKLTEIKLSQIRTNNSGITYTNIPNDNVYFKELEFIMKEEKIYLDSNLGLENISKRLQISSNYLSQLINKLVGSNFSDYINSHRVEEVKSKLKDPDFSNYTILGIAMESGFNSKSPFYSAFKKHTGISPKEYKQRQIIS